ncbi:MAG TPA: hypothetical protein VNG89_12300 [Vicinamibacterales bacterium]|nr:hypothetical protein [Vicinamibacterales bacterium]
MDTAVLTVEHATLVRPDCFDFALKYVQQSHDVSPQPVRGVNAAATAAPPVDSVAVSSTN